MPNIQALLRSKWSLAAMLMALVITLWPGTAYGGFGNGGGGRDWGKGKLGHGHIRVGVGVGVPTTTTSPTHAGGNYYWHSYPCPQCSLLGVVCNSSGQFITLPHPVQQLAPGDTAPMYFQLMGPKGPIGDPKLICSTYRPPPPNPAQVWDSAPLPAAQIDFNPSRVGLTQLQTWFWLSNDSGPLTLSASVGGYTVSLAVRPVSFHWDFGDGTSADSSVSGEPGGAAEASAVHTYTEPGTYRVGVTVTWGGAYTFTGYGVDEVVSLGLVSQPEQFHDYMVQQIRSVLVPASS